MMTLILVPYEAQEQLSTSISHGGVGVCRKTSEKRFTQRRKERKEEERRFVILYNIRNYYILLPLRLSVLA